MSILYLLCLVYLLDTHVASAARNFTRQRLR